MEEEDALGVGTLVGSNALSSIRSASVALLRTLRAESHSVVSPASIPASSVWAPAAVSMAAALARSYSRSSVSSAPPKASLRRFIRRDTRPSSVQTLRRPQ